MDEFDEGVGGISATLDALCVVEGVTKRCVGGP
jgi:hypothetical protein